MFTSNEPLFFLFSRDILYPLLNFVLIVLQAHTNTRTIVFYVWLKLRNCD